VQKKYIKKVVPIAPSIIKIPNQPPSYEINRRWNEINYYYDYCYYYYYYYCSSLTAKRWQAILFSGKHTSSSLNFEPQLITRNPQYYKSLNSFYPLNKSKACLDLMGLCSAWKSHWKLNKSSNGLMAIQAWSPPYGGEGWWGKSWARTPYI
jgi:hypothetical protein